MNRLAKLVLMLTILLLCGTGFALAADLVVETVTISPSTDISEGREVTFSAAVSNNSSAFATIVSVDFQINGSSVATSLINAAEEPFSQEETRTVTATWTAEAGEHTLTVVADSTGVVEEDNEANNTLSVNLSVAADGTAPEAITGLTVSDSTETSLTFSWTHSADSQGDLAGYKVYFNGAVEPELLPATQAVFQKTGLTSASAYDIQVIAYDQAGNDSEGVSLTGYTVMDNPSGLIASPRPALMDLSWEPAANEGWVKHYAVYVSDTDFLTVEEMSPYDTTSDTSMTVAGLENDRTYYFAVVAVNLSDGMNADITTISAATVRGTAVSGNITQNTTWSVENSPYVVTGDVTIRYSNLSWGNVYATLTIEPGVEIRFEAGTGLYVSQQYGTRTDNYGYHGALSVQGTEASPVVFTSNTVDPAPGDWKGITFLNWTVDDNSLLEHCIVEYGGNTTDANIYMSNVNITLRYSTVRHSSAKGIQLINSSSEISNCTISDNASDGIYVDTASTATITSNTINDNAGYAVNVHPNQIHAINYNKGSGNGHELGCPNPGI